MTEQTAKLPSSGLFPEANVAEPVAVVREHVRRILLRVCKSATPDAEPVLDKALELA